MGADVTEACEFGWQGDNAAHDCLLDAGHEGWHECFCGEVCEPIQRRLPAEQQQEE